MTCEGEPDFFLLRMEIGVGTVPDKLKQAVPLEVKAAESLEAKHNRLRVRRFASLWGC